MSAKRINPNGALSFRARLKEKRQALLNGDSVMLPTLLQQLTNVDPELERQEKLNTIERENTQRCKSLSLHRDVLRLHVEQERLSELKRHLQSAVLIPSDLKRALEEVECKKNIVARELECLTRGYGPIQRKLEKSVEETRLRERQKFLSNELTNKLLLLPCQIANSFPRIVANPLIQEEVRLIKLELHQIHTIFEQQNAQKVAEQRKMDGEQFGPEFQDAQDNEDKKAQIQLMDELNGYDIPDE